MPLSSRAVRLMEACDSVCKRLASLPEASTKLGKCRDEGVSEVGTLYNTQHSLCDCEVGRRRQGRRRMSPIAYVQNSL